MKRAETSLGSSAGAGVNSGGLGGGIGIGGGKGVPGGCWSSYLFLGAGGCGGGRRGSCGWRMSSAVMVIPRQENKRKIAHLRIE
jgi:hypothetical protein